jgi:hypothetical protein
MELDLDIKYVSMSQTSFQAPSINLNTISYMIRYIRMYIKGIQITSSIGQTLHDFVQHRQMVGQVKTLP